MINNSIKLLLVPPGGWSFSQPLDGGGAFVITGQTYQQLEDRVFDFRINNLEVIASGSAERSKVREDIRMTICSKFPEQCVGNWNIPERDHPSRDYSTGYTAPIQRIEDWFKMISIKDIQWKDASRAFACADTCSTCPQNIGWKTDCKPCGEAINKRILRYKGDKMTPIDPQLRACRVFGHHNELAIWMKDPFSQPKAGEEVPEFCWNKS